MTYSDFAEKMLIALYQESESDEPYPEGITFGALIERYGLPDNERWIDRLAKEWEMEGLADVSDELTASRNLEVQISGRGMRRVEQVYGGKDGVGTILEPIPPGATLEPFFEESETSSDGTDSSAWTGLPRDFVLTEEKRVALVRGLDAAEQGLSGLRLGQEVQAQARAYIVAARSLAEAPEPQPDLIWEILNRANSIAGIASLFVSILALFV